MRRKSSYLLWTGIPILTVLNQACMKLLSAQMQAIPFGWDWLVRAVQNPCMLGILLCEVASFVLWLTILSDMGISKATPISAIVYILILAMGWTVFHEPVMPLQIAGSFLILAGVFLISTASTHKTHE